MTDRIGRAVLELSTDATGLLKGFADAKTGGRGVDTEFEKLRRSAQGLGTEFQRMVERFDGRRVVDQARLVARAVDQVGGVAKLTQSEMRQVAATVDAATDKLRRMGEEVPPSLRKLQDEIQQVDRASGRAAAGGLGSMRTALGGLKTLLPALTLVGAVSFIGQLASEALNASDKIVTLSTRTGASIETTQRWMHVAGQTSTTVEAFAAASQRLGVAVATGTDKTRQAFADLGMTWRDVKAMNPEEMFDATMAALSRVENVTERNRIGQALFGRQFGEIAVAVEEDYGEIASAAAIAGEAQVRAAEAAGDAWQKAKDKINAAAINILGRLAQEFQDKPIDMSWMNPEQLQRYAMLLKTQGDAYGYLLELERERTKGMRDYNLEVEDGTSKGADYVAQLAAIRAEVAVLSDAQRAQIRAANEAGESQSDIDEALGVTEGAIRLYLKQVEEAAKKEREATEAAERFAESVRRIPIVFRGWNTIPETVRDTREEIDEVRASMEAMANIRPIEPGVWEPFKQGVNDSRTLLQRLRESMDFRKSLKDGLLDAVADIPGILQRAFEGGGGLGGALQSIAVQIGSQIGASIGQSIGTSIGGPTGGRIGRNIGALIGSIPGTLIGRIGREERHVNDLRDAAFAAAGGFQKLHERLAAAGFSMERLLRARDVRTWEREWAAANEALERHQELLEEQARQLEENKRQASDLFSEIMELGRDGIPDAMRPAIESLIELGLLTEEQIEALRGLGNAGAINIQKMEEAMRVLNGRVESLGPAFAQAKINEQAMSYANAIETILKGGGDWGSTMMDAREELGALAAEAIRTGRTLPENLRPWIEDLMASGNLIDENGKKITDISGIKWGAKMETEGQKANRLWESILAKITELVDRLTGPLNTAIDNVTRDRTMDVDLTIRERHQRDNEHGTNPPELNGGTFRWRTGAAGMLARLHDVESVVPKSKELAFVARVLSELPGASTSNVTNNSQQIAPVAIFYPDRRGGIDGSAINRHLASVSGIASNDFGLREVIEAIARGVARQEMRRA